MQHKLEWSVSHDGHLEAGCTQSDCGWWTELSGSTYTTEQLVELEEQHSGPIAHQVQFDEAGWTLLHPISCRPHLFECKLNDAAKRIWGPGDHPESGRYECRLENGAVIIGNRIEAVSAD